jgi:hypothetical protein
MQFQSPRERATYLIPNIPLVIVNLMCAQEIKELILEGSFPMVLLLVTDVFEYLRSI